MFPGLFVTCFFVNLPWTHIYLLVDCCWAARVVSHRSTVSDFDLSPSMCQSSSMVACSEVSKNRRSEQEFRPWSKMIPIHVISHKTTVISWSFKIWTWISGSSFFFWTFFVENVAWGRLPLYTQLWTTAVLLAVFQPFCMGINSLSLFFEMSTSIYLNLFTWFWS